MKICSKCKVEKDLSEFSKDNSRNDGFQCYCIECNKEYYENNKDNKRKWYQKNKKKILERLKKYYSKNYMNIINRIKENRVKNYKKYIKYQKEYSQKYRKRKANFDTYAQQISYAEKVKNVDGFLQVKCAYCGKWCFPIVQEIQCRVSALNGQAKGEQRLYCSTECKTACPIYRKQIYQEGHPLKNQNSSREVQPELRQLVFERDEYTCIKCGKHQDELLNIPLHCHHIEGIKHNPIESADIDMCVTVCKTCHNEIHQQDGCGYNDMKCKGETK